MSGGGYQCYASCPPSTVTIQPPPFVLNIPGPALYCPDQPLQIQQQNPCVTGGYGTALYEKDYGSNFSNFYSRGLPSSSYYSSFRY